MLVFKAAEAPPGKARGRKGTVTYEIYHDLPDQWRNQYPLKEKCYAMVSKTANSSGDLPIDFINIDFFPAVCVVDGELQRPAVALCDAFSGHYDKHVKARNKLHLLFAWPMMHGGITPMFQPLDVLANKVDKGYFRNLFKEWPLNSPINETTDNPLLFCASFLHSGWWMHGIVFQKPS